MDALGLAVWFVRFLTAYVVVGLLFAPAFVIKGVQRIDPHAQGAPLGFRLLILPGSVAFWPLLLARWAGGATSPPVERSPHRLEAARRDARRGPGSAP
jgi:hypothetical protein